MALCALYNIEKLICFESVYEIAVSYHIGHVTCDVFMLSMNKQITKRLKSEVRIIGEGCIYSIGKRIFN